MERKSSTLKIRTTGDLPNIPGDIAKDYPSLENWWDDSVAVIDRMRGSSSGSGSGTSTSTSTSSAAPTVITKTITNKPMSIVNPVVKMTAEEIKNTLGIIGEAVGTENEQDMDNKFIGGGSF